MIIFSILTFQEINSERVGLFSVLIYNDIANNPIHNSQLLILKSERVSLFSILNAQDIVSDPILNFQEIKSDFNIFFCFTKV